MNYNNALILFSLLFQNIYIYFALGLGPDPFCVVIEFASLGALDELLYGKRKNTVISEANMKKIVIGAARGIAHLHHEKVVHRDIAARNVLLMGD